jgi:N-acetylglucosaminyl-diphospho-decaprenol L-rhamnosyltransferase
LIKIDVICVGFRSERFYPAFLASMREQRDVDLHILIIEHGGSVPLLDGRGLSVTVKTGENIGYAGGNNRGFELSRANADVVVFINPDCFPVRANFLFLGATDLMAEHALGALQPVLLRYDFEKMWPTGEYDSLGIACSSWGQWRDIEQGKPVRSNIGSLKKVDALCGACIFARRLALTGLISRDGFVFDPTFFMYKEDIDFSLRLVSLGYNLKTHPHLEAYHCRGWRSRSDISWDLRHRAACNEWRINKRKPLHALYTLAKLVYVLCWERRSG